MVRQSIELSFSYWSSFEQTTVMDGESLPESLTPERNSPSPQFLSESLNLHPSFSENALLELPPPPEPEALACTAVVPSKFEQ